MIALDATTQSIEIATSSTANLDYACSWIDTTTNLFTPGSSHGTVAAATTTTIISAPGASTQRGVKHISLRNRHASTAQTVTVKKNVSATLYEIVKATLAAGEAIIYEEGAGWQTYATDGQPKVNSSGINGAAGATGAPGVGTTGTATLDFGAFPGASDASVAVTGQAAIGAGSVVEAWRRIVASADHSADEHWVETLDVFAGNIIAGTGFTIYGKNTNPLAEPITGPLETMRLVGPGAGANPQSPVKGGQGTRLYGQWTVQWRWS